MILEKYERARHGDRKTMRAQETYRHPCTFPADVSKRLPATGIAQSQLAMAQNVLPSCFLKIGRAFVAPSVFVCDVSILY